MFAAALSILTGEFEGMVRRRVNVAALYALAAAFAFFAVGFFLISFRDWIDVMVYPIDANLVVGSLLLFVALVIFAIAAWRRRVRRSSNALPAAMVLAAPAAARVTSKVVSPELLALGIVVISGLWLGRRLGRD
jgi:hypothetical protein